MTVIEAPVWQGRTDHPTVVVPDYPNVESWALDSDYEYRDGQWFSEHGPVDIVDCCHDAHEASGEPLGERVRLTGWGTFAELGTSVKALLFGEMVKRATEITEHYHGDLWHDATRIALMGGPCRFWWGPRECGTDMGESLLPDGTFAGWWKASSLLDHLAKDSTFVGYWVEVTCEVSDYHAGAPEPNGCWYATFTPMRERS